MSFLRTWCVEVCLARRYGSYHALHEIQAFESLYICTSLSPMPGVHVTIKEISDKTLIADLDLG